MPLPTSRAMDPRWSEHHRPSVTSAMSSSCQIVRNAADGSTGDDGTWTPPATEIIYSGLCRIVRDVSDEAHPIVGDRRLTTQRYSLQIRYDSAEIRIGDIAQVTSSVDLELNNRRFRVEAVMVASEQWSRNLMVIEFEEGI